MINEVVFADRGKIDDKKKSIGLTYTKGNRAQNNANPFDRLGTDEMDQENANTIEVPLKGGLISYNITDIKGTEIMHYFKKKWAQRQRVTIDVTKQNGDKEAYNLEMNSSDENQFIKRFVHKVELVIQAWINKNKREDLEFSGISILPVDSTSNFNEIFVRKELSHLNINGLACKVVDPQIIVKDTKNIQRDEEFIKKNLKFYNSDYAVGKPEFGTVNQRVNNVISKNNALFAVNEKVTEINNLAQKLLNFLRNHKKASDFTPLQIKNLTRHYKKYVDLIRDCYSTTYSGVIDNKEHGFHREQVLNRIKYSKGPSIDNRSPLLWQMVKPYIRNERSPIDNKPYIEMPLCLWKKKDFEIKTLRNSERLGLQNIYNVNSNWDENKIQEEVNRIKGTILLIFDDNISGGATLSDVCLQCKKLGLDNIIPITFGKMGESNSMGGLTLSTPEDGYDFSTDNNLSLYSGAKKEKRKLVKRVDKLEYGKKTFYKNHDVVNNQPLTILWLDDVREPYSYFAIPKSSGSWKRNNEYYANNIFTSYNPNFVWVKNLKEFKHYILNNPMPDLISFDYDITPKNYNKNHENGGDVAQWLVDFCQTNDIEMPKTFIHSANKGGRENISTILGTNIYSENIIKLSETELMKIIKETIYNLL